MGTIYLCRHGETESARDDRYHAHEHSLFTALGDRQTAALANQLRGTRIAAVFTGPFERVAITGARVARAHGLPVDVSPLLSEWDPGEWNGLTRDQVQQRHATLYQAWQRDPGERRPPNGESWYD